MNGQSNVSWSEMLDAMAGVGLNPSNPADVKLFGDAVEGMTQDEQLSEIAKRAKASKKGIDILEEGLAKYVEEAQSPRTTTPRKVTIEATRIRGTDQLDEYFAEFARNLTDNINKKEQ